MKKSIFAVAVTAVVLGMSFQASASITNTKHNMSSTDNNAIGGLVGRNGTNRIYSSDNPEICIYCHTPHNAIKNDVIPLWNHDLSKATYGVYTSPTIDASISEVGGLVGDKDATGAVVSNLCLSCHDGTVAINAINNASNGNPDLTMVGVDPTTGGIPSSFSTNLMGGPDDQSLKNDHPINFDYSDAADADLTINSEADAVAGGVKFFDGKLQCPSCHDPHNDTAGEQPFLRVSINGSELCLVCHGK